MPSVYEDYVHRIGRTGRAEKTGTAITLANEAEQYHIRKIEKLIRQPIPLKQLPSEVKVEKTTFVEQQEIARAIDHQKRKENPDFKGAFHEKKVKKELSGRSSQQKKFKKRKR